MDVELYPLITEYSLILAGIVSKPTPASTDIEFNGLTVRRHNNPDLIPGGEATWNNLLSKSPVFSVCMHWKWMSLWRTHFRKENFESVILTFLDNGEKIGIFPLVLIQNNDARLNKRKLYFYGTGEKEVEEITTEYIDLIVKPGYEQRVCEAAASYLFNNFTEWDVLELMRYRKDSIIVNYLFDALRKQGAKQHAYTCGYRHYISLNKSYDQYIASCSKSFRRNLTTHTNRLNALGNVEFKHVTTHEEIEVFLKTLKSMHLERFKGRTAISAFKSKAFTNYHRDLLHYLIEKNQLLLITCELDKRVITAEYILIADNTAYAYQGSFYNKMDKISLGFLSINKAIEIATTRGLHIFDFMLGAEDSYATSYGCEREAMYTSLIYNTKFHNYFSYAKIVLKMRVKGSIIVLKGFIDCIRTRYCLIRRVIKKS